MLPLRICICYEEVIFSEHFEGFEELPYIQDYLKQCII